MPMSLTRATTGVFGLSHHCRSMCVLPQAIIKECTRETACSGGHTGAEAQFPLELLEGFEESRQGSEGMDLWPWAKRNSY